METLRKTGAIVLATLIIWLSVAVVGQTGSNEFVSGVAILLAVLATVTIWSLWALDQYGISVDGTPRERAYEKPKRDADSAEDARVSLLLSLLSPDERDAVRARLIDDLSGDGEAVSLADLLAEQEQDDADADRAS
jgi:hypothetical protein